MGRVRELQDGAARVSAGVYTNEDANTNQSIHTHPPVGPLLSAAGCTRSRACGWSSSSAASRRAGPSTRTSRSSRCPRTRPPRSGGRSRYGTGLCVCASPYLASRMSFVQLTDGDDPRSFIVPLPQHAPTHPAGGGPGPRRLLREPPRRENLTRAGPGPGAAVPLLGGAGAGGQGRAAVSEGYVCAAVFDFGWGGSAIVV